MFTVAPMLVSQIPHAFDLTVGLGPVIGVALLALLLIGALTIIRDAVRAARAVDARERRLHIVSPRVTAQCPKEPPLAA